MGQLSIDPCSKSVILFGRSREAGFLTGGLRPQSPLATPLDYMYVPMN